jgi:primary-amine oxidase
MTITTARMLPLLAGIGLMATQSAAHPLDGLSAPEITAVVEILKADGKTDADSRFPLIELKEPDKAAVLAWRPGDPETRQAVVNVKSAEGTFKGVVDITGRKVLSWEPAEGEAMILLEEFLGAMDLALKDPRMVAGLEKRGLTPAQAFCLPLTAGAFGLPEESGKRLMKVPCYAVPSQSNFYAKPVEGLFAVVDLKGGTVIEVVDEGVVPVPEDPWGYTQDEIDGRDDMVLRAGIKPATLQQPDGANYTIDGGSIAWDIWSFRWRVDKRPGLVLSQIEVRDGGAPRSVLYQAHLSEVFVPYMDPGTGWYWRTYLASHG